jgi:nicotinate-nucleotide adenylyltransferase
MVPDMACVAPSCKVPAGNDQGPPTLSTMLKRRHDFAVRLPMVSAGQRIGLLGGSFNPAHEGHRLISEIALRRLRLDQVWWIVSPGNPLKSHAELAPHAVRITQARAIAAHPRITVTGFEAERASAYTIDTLAFLQRRYPGVRFVWLMGADNLVQMPRWRRWREIFQRMPVAVVDRPGFHLRANAGRAARVFAGVRVPAERAGRLAAQRAPCWTLLTGPLSAQSSTALRARRGRR